MSSARTLDTPLAGSSSSRCTEAPPPSSGPSASLSSEKNGVESEVGSPRDMAAEEDDGDDGLTSDGGRNVYVKHFIRLNLTFYFIY